MHTRTYAYVVHVCRVLVKQNDRLTHEWGLQVTVLSARLQQRMLEIDSSIGQIEIKLAAATRS